MGELEMASPVGVPLMGKSEIFIGTNGDGFRADGIGVDDLGFWGIGEIGRGG